MKKASFDQLKPGDLVTPDADYIRGIIIYIVKTVQINGPNSRTQLLLFCNHTSLSLGSLYTEAFYYPGQHRGWLLLDETEAQIHRDHHK